MRAGAWVVLAGAVLAAGPGCARINYTAPERYEHGLVVCLSGAGGLMGEVDRVRRGLHKGGVGSAIETFEWSRGEVFGDQTDVEANRRKAAQLARRVEAYQREHPDRPVNLVGVSAGTGLVVWALEELRPGHRATNAVLIASSLDCRYDLSRALQKLSGNLYSYHSLMDTVLSLGVTWAGTVDRGGGISGGLVGFSAPDDAPPPTRTLYEMKLKQFGWTPIDLLLGHLGDHLGATNPAFVRERIAPLLRPAAAEKPSQEKKPVAAGRAARPGGKGDASP